MSFCTEEWSILENGRFDPAPAFVYGNFLLPSSEEMQFFIFLIIFLLEMWMFIPFFPTHYNQQLCLLFLLLDSVVLLNCPMTRYPILF